MENGEKQRLYIDMDGTLAVFKPVDQLETLYEKGYFANLEPHENVVAAVKNIITEHPDIEVHILSAYLTDSAYAMEEKNAWLDKYLPEINQEHRVFVPCGSDKKEGIRGGIRSNDFLLDDYTVNLNDWQPPARGIKLLNAINHTRGSWMHDRIRYDRNPEDLAQGIVDVMHNDKQIFDDKVTRLEEKAMESQETGYVLPAPTQLGEDIFKFFAENDVNHDYGVKLFDQKLGQEGQDKEELIDRVTEKILQDRGSRYILPIQNLAENNPAIQEKAETLIQNIKDRENYPHSIDEKWASKMNELGYEQVKFNGFYDDYTLWNKQGSMDLKLSFGFDGWGKVQEFVETYESTRAIKNLFEKINLPSYAERVEQFTTNLQDYTECVEFLRQEKQNAERAHDPATEKLQRDTLKEILDEMYEIREFAQQLPEEKSVQESEHQETDKPAAKAQTQMSRFKGYLNYTGGYSIVSGDSAEAILQKIAKMNERRDDAHKYKVCKIGQLDPTQNKYENYQKYDVLTGKNITPVILDVPNGLSKEEFSNLIKQYKEKGARFNAQTKQWYISQEQKENFSDILKDSHKRNQEPEPKQNQESVIESSAEKKSVLDLVAGIDNEYVIKLTSGDEIRISQREVMERAGAATMEELSAVQIVDALEKSVEERVQDKQIPQQMEQKAPEVEAEIPAPVSSAPYSIGEQVSLYVPEYAYSASGVKEICGMKEIAGEVQAVSEKGVQIKESEGTVHSVSEFYDERQAAIMTRACKLELKPVEMDLVGQPKLSAAQMEQVLNGIQDGLSCNQVALYANQSISAADMDIYRYGMSNGITYDNIEGIISKNIGKETGWEDSRNMVDKMIKAQRNLIIKDLKDNNLRPEQHLVMKIEKLNGLTGRLNHIGNIHEISASGDSEIGKLLKDIGGEVKHQRMQLSRSSSEKLKPNVPCR